MRAERNSFTDLTDLKFKSMFRLTKSICKTLLDEIQPHLQEPKRATGISCRARILCALRFFATGMQNRFQFFFVTAMHNRLNIWLIIIFCVIGSYQQLIGGDTYLSMSQPSVSRAIKEVAYVIVDKLGRKHIDMLSPENRALTKQK